MGVEEQKDGEGRGIEGGWKGGREGWWERGREGGREEGREGWWERGRKGGRDGGREGGREGGMVGEREEEKKKIRVRAIRTARQNWFENTTEMASSDVMH